MLNLNIDGNEIEKKLQSAQQELIKLQDSVQTKELIIQDLMKIQRDHQGNVMGQSELDQKILDELESTKRLLKNYEVCQIVTNYSGTNSGKKS